MVSTTQTSWMPCSNRLELCNNIFHEGEVYPDATLNDIGEGVTHLLPIESTFQDIVTSKQRSNITQERKEKI
jgi:hypothetical protein